MRIVFNPPENKENRYISILVESLKQAGFEVYPLDNLLSSYRHFKSIRLVHLNWFENIDDSSFKKAVTSFFRKLIVLGAIRLGNKKLVWTMHNRTSHEKGLSFFSKTLTKLLMWSAHRIIIHSHESETLLTAYSPKLLSKTQYLPHPDFVDIYGPLQPNRKEDTRLRLLFIGTIKPYKNIELLIDLAKAFPSSLHLTIAGNPSSISYKEELEQLALSAHNISLDLNFIPDAKIPSLFAEADALILPYDLSSSLNSGTVILAFSYGKTVICPAIGTIKDLGELQEQVFTYTYQTATEHRRLLGQKVQEAIMLKTIDARTFEERGQQLYAYVKNKHNKQKVGEALVEVYQHLIPNRNTFPQQ